MSISVLNNNVIYILTLFLCADVHLEERPISAQSYLRGCYWAGLG